MSFRSGSGTISSGGASRRLSCAREPRRAAISVRPETGPGRAVGGGSGSRRTALPTRAARMGGAFRRAARGPGATRRRTRRTRSTRRPRGWPRSSPGQPCRLLVSGDRHRTPSAPDGRIGARDPVRIRLIGAKPDPLRSRLRVPGPSRAAAAGARRDRGPERPHQSAATIDL
jgi:hypothetical protein